MMSGSNSYLRLHRIVAGIGRDHEAGYSCDIYNSFLGRQWILKISNIDIDTVVGVSGPTMMTNPHVCKLVFVVWCSVVWCSVDITEYVCGRYEHCRHGGCNQVNVVVTVVERS